MDIRAEWKRGPVLFDGAMGTYFAQNHPGERCELASLTRPEEISAIHRAYLEAGCRAIKTNTFTVSGDLGFGHTPMARQIIQESCRLALEAARPWDGYVFGDIGPAPEGGALSPGESFIQQMELFLEQGVEHILVETLSSDAGIAKLAQALKERCPRAVLLVSYAVSFDGTTQEGYSGRELLRRTAALEGVDGVGLNCVSGPKHLLEYVQRLELGDTVLSAMPNAGYPTVLGRRTVFQGTPDYFGQKAAELVQAGVRIVGGCCGTTPEHIAAAARALASPPPPRIRAAPPREPSAHPEENSLAGKLDSGKRVVAVELDPPVDDNIGFFLEGVQDLKRAGADVVTIADNPVGRPRADSCLLACKIKRELGVEPLPHMTCRDRNLNAVKALLLGLSIEGVHNVLLVTGDPIPSQDRDEVKSVFNFNSRKLARYVRGLNEELLRTPFRIFGALDLNARNFEVQLRLAQEKEENGVTGFLTQPVLSREALENLKLARQTLEGKILGGVFPVVSHKNACFLNNEIAGMRVCEEIVALYEGKNREEGEALAVDISTQIAREISPYTDGLYLMTPFKRVALMVEILRRL